MQHDIFLFDSLINYCKSLCSHFCVNHTINHYCVFQLVNRCVSKIRATTTDARRPRRAKHEKRLEPPLIRHDKHAIFSTDVHFLSRAWTLNHHCNCHTGDSSILHATRNVVSNTWGEVVRGIQFMHPAQNGSIASLICQRMFICRNLLQADTLRKI